MSPLHTWMDARGNDRGAKAAPDAAGTTAEQAPALRSPPTASSAHDRVMRGTARSRLVVDTAWLCAWMWRVGRAGTVLVELSVVEQRYHAVMEVAAGVRVTQVAAR
jgi:hypothetical protein